ncbi:type II secretion system F family protein [Rhodopirellula sp. MGV]|uniref:type II secretion system F family protein n=1 Tax=Rhodopirellula sp. MGV TaxID=2023130 RepID=UPI000B975296|nr:type II secretion system F family protein [Rhodopirellula sp. MGV]OYP33170.1 hypothetical protein CGZ80_18285 [Rhodopirellula sp. MGV]PNY35098.1 type II secretion system F family protein [Rhodopirellula baltica]
MGTQVVTILAVFVFTAIVVYLVMSQFNRYGVTVHRRMESLYSDGVPQQIERKQWIDRKKLGELFAKLSKYGSLSKLAQTETLQKRLASAAIRNKSAVHFFLAVRGGLVILPVIVSFLAWQLHWCTGTVAVYILFGGSALGWIIPILWLNSKLTRYRSTLKASLPDFLDLVVVCLDAGLSLQDSLRRVAGELQSAHRELALEMAGVQRDVELGSSLDMAMKRLAERTDYEPVQILSSLISEGHRHGANIADALRSHSDTLRYQREQAAEENAQKASVKIMLPMMVCIFPATFIVLVGPAAIKIYEAFSVK